MNRMPRHHVCFSHHLILCIYGGFIIGASESIILLGQAGGDPGILVPVWMVLGTLHGPLLWPLLYRRPWWSTSLVFSMAVVAAGVVGLTSGGVQNAVTFPLIALWGAALLGSRILAESFETGHCQKCGYDLQRLPEARCPECGAGFEREEDELAQGRGK